MSGEDGTQQVKALYCQCRENTPPKQQTSKMNSNALWSDCLQKIRQQLLTDYEQRGGKARGERIFDTWFRPVTMYHYDEERHALTLSVPSAYIQEALEQFFPSLLKRVLPATFGNGVQLYYKVGKDPGFGDVAQYLRRQQQGHDAQGRVNVAVADARQRIEKGLEYYLHGRQKWLPEYDKVADWLTDNKGRGLLICGTTGLGKTLLCRDILPVILTSVGHGVVTVTAKEMRSRVEELKKARIVVIDDLGKEDSRHYGEKDTTFFDLCDNAERTGNLLIITTNLSTNAITNPLYPDSIEHRYGSEVLDRLKVITRGFRIQGTSLRGS